MKLRDILLVKVLRLIMRHWYKATSAFDNEKLPHWWYALYTPSASRLYNDYLARN